MDGQQAKCTACGHHNDGENLFCGRCGTVLRPCSRCGRPNQAADGFCRTCGTTLTSSQAARAPRPERSQPNTPTSPPGTSTSTPDRLRTSSVVSATDQASPALPLQASISDQLHQEPGDPSSRPPGEPSRRSSPAAWPDWMQSSIRADTVEREPLQSPPSRTQWRPASSHDPLVDVAQRPLWLVVALTLLTLGLYQIVWLGITWAEMKRELRDDSMRPWGHALSLFVPIYGWTRVHAHYRTINELLEEVGRAPGLSPGLATAGWVIANVVGTASGNPAVPAEAFVGMLFVSTALAVFVVVRGQAELNTYWHESRFTGVPSRVYWGERLVLIALPLIIALVLFR